jgi:hypothetical protein
VLPELFAVVARDHDGRAPKEPASLERPPDGLHRLVGACHAAVVERQQVLELGVGRSEPTARERETEQTRCVALAVRLESTAGESGRKAAIPVGRMRHVGMEEEEEPRLILRFDPRNGGLCTALGGEDVESTIDAVVCRDERGSRDARGSISGASKELGEKRRCMVQTPVVRIGRERARVTTREHRCMRGKRPGRG